LLERRTNREGSKGNLTTVAAGAARQYPLGVVQRPKFQHEERHEKLWQRFELMRRLERLGAGEGRTKRARCWRRYRCLSGNNKNSFKKLKTKQKQGTNQNKRQHSGRNFFGAQGAENGNLMGG